MEEEEQSKKKKSFRIKSGIFAKASSTKLIEEVLHAHAALDEDETVKGGDYNVHKLPFHLLVAGKMEIILSESTSAGEKWSRGMALRALAYNKEFLSNEIILACYAAFLRKIKKGTAR